MFDTKKSRNYGLAISQKVCKQLGGSLELEQDNDGHFFRFNIVCSATGQTAGTLLSGEKRLSSGRNGAVRTKIMYISQNHLDKLAVKFLMKELGLLSKLSFAYKLEEAVTQLR